MSALELYAKQTINTKGIIHLHAIDSLRRYMNLESDEHLIMYLNTITDIDILKAIQEAGARKAIYTALISRMNMLMKEQQEAKK